jgi:hypothetical protein
MPGPGYIAVKHPSTDRESRVVAVHFSHFRNSSGMILASMKAGSVIALFVLAVAAIYVSAAGWVRVEVETALAQGTFKASVPTDYDGITFNREADRSLH